MNDTIQLSVGDVVDFQLRSELDDAGEIIRGRVAKIGQIIDGAPAFQLADGTVYLLSSLRRFHNVTAAEL